jgi:hypothetical protein
VHFVHIELQAPESEIAALADFYGSKLGLPSTPGADRVSVRIGETTLELAGGPSAAFYHFALLIPGNRFDAALAWADARATLLPEPRSGDVVFDFDFWHAKACYFHDPAENIVELIAHRGIGETDARGEFGGAELLGVSELGLVGDLRAMADSLERALSLELWDGTVEGGLVFVGEQARTLILAPSGRGWLPTGRAAEQHNVAAVLSGPPEGEISLEGSRYRVGRSGT